MSDHQVVETQPNDDSDFDTVVAEATAEVEKESPSEIAPEPEAEEKAEPETEAKPQSEAEESPEAEDKEEVVEEKAEEPEDHDLGLTADQLDKLRETPEGLALYKSVQRGLTKKATDFAERRKELEQKAEIAEYLQKYPEKAFEQLAEKLGRRTAPSEQEEKVEAAVDEHLKKWTELLGEEEKAKVFWPALKDDIIAIAKELVAPLTQQQEEVQQKAIEREHAAGVAQFEARVKERGDDYGPEIEQKMADKMKIMQPAEGVSLQDYLDTLYDSVAMDATRVATKKAALARLRKAEKKDEPTAATRAAKTESATITADMSEDDAIDLAIMQAEKESR
jgi:hypothetical protein